MRMPQTTTSMPSSSATFGCLSVRTHAYVCEQNGKFVPYSTCHCCCSSFSFDYPFIPRQSALVRLSSARRFVISRTDRYITTLSSHKFGYCDCNLTRKPLRGAQTRRKTAFEGGTQRGRTLCGGDVDAMISLLSEESVSSVETHFSSKYAEERTALHVFEVVKDSVIDAKQKTMKNRKNGGHIVSPSMSGTETKVEEVEGKIGSRWDLRKKTEKRLEDPKASNLATEDVNSLLMCKRFEEYSVERDNQRGLDVVKNQRTKVKEKLSTNEMKGNDQVAFAGEHDTASCSRSSSRFTGKFQENVRNEDSSRRVNEKIFSDPEKRKAESRDVSIERVRGSDVIYKESEAGFEVKAQSENLEMGNMGRVSGTKKQSSVQTEMKRFEFAEKQSKSDLRLIDAGVQFTGFAATGRSQAERFKPVSGGHFGKTEQETEQLSAKQCTFDHEIRVTEFSSRKKTEQEKEYLASKQSTSEFQLLDHHIQQVIDSATISQNETQHEKEYLTAKQSTSEVQLLDHDIQVIGSAIISRNKKKQEKEYFIAEQSTNKFQLIDHDVQVLDSSTTRRNETEQVKEYLTAKQSTNEFQLIDHDIQVLNYATVSGNETEQEKEYLTEKQSTIEFQLLDHDIQVIDSATICRNETKRGKEYLTEKQSADDVQSLDHGIQLIGCATISQNETEQDIEYLTVKQSTNDVQSLDHGIQLIGSATISRNETEQDKECMTVKQSTNDVQSLDHGIQPIGCATMSRNETEQEKEYLIKSQSTSSSRNEAELQKEQFIAQHNAVEFKLIDPDIQVIDSATNSRSKTEQNVSEFHFSTINLNKRESETRRFQLAGAVLTEQIGHEKEKPMEKPNASEVDSNIDVHLKKVAGSATSGRSITGSETKRMEHSSKFKKVEEELETVTAIQSQREGRLFDSDIQVAGSATAGQSITGSEMQRLKHSSEVHLKKLEKEEELRTATHSQSEGRIMGSNIHVAGSAATGLGETGSDARRLKHSSNVHFNKPEKEEESLTEIQSQSEGPIHGSNIQVAGSATTGPIKTGSETRRSGHSSKDHVKKRQEEQIGAEQNWSEFQLLGTDVQVTGSATSIQTETQRKTQRFEHTSDAHIKKSEEEEGLPKLQPKVELQSLDVEIQDTDAWYEANELPNVSVNLTNEPLGYQESVDQSSPSYSKSSDITGNPPENMLLVSNEPESKKQDSESWEASVPVDNTIPKRSGKSLWNIISSIFRVKGRSDSSNTSAKKHLSNESMSSEAYYSGIEPDEKNDDIVPKIASSGSSEELESASSSGKNDGEVKKNVKMLQRNKHVLRDKFDAWEEAYVIESEQRNADEFFMREALKEAKNAGDMWEVPVGAVLVHNGAIISRAHNLVEQLRDPTAHAELMCIREASNQLRTWRLADVTLYVTLEPCAMCAGAILQARVKTLVWGAPNKQLGADGSWIRLFRGDAGNASDSPGPVHPYHTSMVIRRGVLESECAEMMQQFFQLRRKKSKDQEEENPPRPTLQIANRHSKIVSKMHDIFHAMLCL